MKRINISTKTYPHKFTMVDDADFKWLNQWKWCYAGLNDSDYATRGVKKDGKIITIKMHRLIMGLQKGDGLFVDHINHNGLDNQRTNLRLCNNSENQWNRRLQGGTSKYKGVSWGPRQHKWSAYIAKNGHRYHLGYFKLEVDAAKAYDKKAIELHGKFAYLNFQKKRR